MQTETLQVYENSKAEIDSQIATAKAFPRNLTLALKNMQIEIQSSKEFAESCNYALPPKSDGKIISGPSIHLAKIIAQNLGNIKYGARVVDIDKSHVTSQGICIDLERNISSSIEVKRSIIGNSGRYSEHMITVTGNAANSIALRNAIFAVVSKGIVDKMYKMAKKAAIGDISTKDKFLARRTEIVNKIKDVFKVTDEEVLFSLGKESMEFIEEEHLGILLGYINAIKDGDASIDFIFRGKKPEPVINEREQRLIEQIENTKNVAQLEGLKTRVRSVPERKSYDEQYNKLKNQK